MLFSNVWSPSHAVHTHRNGEETTWDLQYHLSVIPNPGRLILGYVTHMPCFLVVGTKYRAPAKGGVIYL